MPEYGKGEMKLEKEKQEIPQIELFTPLSGNFFPNHASYDLDEEIDEMYGEPLTGADLVQYEEAIQEMVQKYNMIGREDGTPNNLMEYFTGSDAVKQKVESAVVSVKSADGVLYGCTTLTMNEFLESRELKELCEYITGQYSDGWGEGFEQREIAVDGGTLNVHFYQSDSFRIQEKETTDPREKSVQKPKMKLLGQDGNIFSIMGRAHRLLAANGQEKEAGEMFRRVQESGSYYAALGIISEYVETELSTPKEQRKDGKRPRKGECR